MNKMKGLILLSGGLDSILATKLILDQGIDVIAINFVTPFHTSESKWASKIAKKLRIPLKTVKLGKDYLKIIRKPKFRYGKNMNPCIDCRIFMLKKAKAYAKKINASFLVTGEVLGERPMTQTREALDIIEKEAGLKRKILRPLSAKLLSKTEAEKKGWVDREKLLDIRGRSRKKQIELAKKYKIKEYPSPGGGCLLTYKEFAAKVRDLVVNEKRLRMKDIPLLKIGRHFRSGKNKIIVGRNKDENKQLLKLKNVSDYYFEVPGYGSPITLLQGPKTKVAIEKTAALTARYSDSKEKKTMVRFGKKRLENSIKIPALDDKEIKELRV
jgi:tRNA U34 2-thiouridine synthase MnmA/TrmU